MQKELINLRKLCEYNKQLQKQKMEQYEKITHYSDKPIAAMTERDWRIFREDFEITSKGNMRHPQTGQRILPFRHWYESGLPDNILAAIRKARVGVGALLPAWIGDGLSGLLLVYAATCCQLVLRKAVAAGRAAPGLHVR